MVQTTLLGHPTSLCALVGLATNPISLLPLNTYPRLNMHNGKRSIANYAVLSGPLSTPLIPIFRPRNTCELVWSEARALYTNDAQRLYNMCKDLMTVQAP